MAPKRKAKDAALTDNEPRVTRSSKRLAGASDKKALEPTNREAVNRPASKKRKAETATSPTVKRAKTVPAREAGTSEKPKNSKASAEPSVNRNQQETEPSNEVTRQFWLLKSEPETRLENGIDIRFSIDDLAAQKHPEPWDGIRNHVAKNNLLRMRKGDLAFFYHSNCKVPGIVGLMKVVEEAADNPDEKQFDPKSPYYDLKATREKPRWFAPKVEFVCKFGEIWSLHAIREEAKTATELEHLQLLKMSRLSVSRVTHAEYVSISAHIAGFAELRKAHDLP